MFRSLLPDCCPSRKTTGVMQRQEGDKIVLYRGHQLMVLGVYAAEIWQLCDGSHSLQEMIDRVVNLYDIEPARAKQEIASFLMDLENKRLIAL